VRESGVMQALVWATRPFVEVFLASTPAAFALWSCVSAVILVAVLAVIVLSDVAFTESSLAASRRVEARLRRMRAGGGAFGGARQGSPRVRLPALPRVGGAGALAWRQGVELLRNLRSVLLMAVLTVLFPVLPAFLASASANSRAGASPFSGELSRSAPFFAVIFLTTLLTQYAFFDFRRDLDRMGYLKSLPVSAVAVAAGQLTASTFLLFVLQCIAVVALAAFDSAPPPALLAASLLALLPLDWLAVAIDNALFLQFPYRPLPKETGQMPFVGRMMLIFALKGAILSVVLGAGVLVALLVHALTGSVVLGGAFAAVLFVAVCLPATLLVALAFRRFDVSRDIPS